MQPSAALSKFATWNSNLGVPCALRYTLYRIFHRILGARVLTLHVRGFVQPVYCRAGGSDLRASAKFFPIANIVASIKSISLA